MEEYKPYEIDLSEIKYSDKPQLLSEFVDSIFYTKLSEEPLIPNIWNIGITVDSDALYLEGDFIYKYTLDGKFVKSLFIKGNGPEEVTLKATKAAYNLKDNYVTVNNNGAGCYNTYSLDGNYVGAEKIDPYKSKRIIGYWNNKQLFYYWFDYPARGENVNLDGPYFLYAKDIITDSIVYKLPNHHFNIKGEAQGSVVIGGGYPLNYGSIDSLFWMKHTHVDTIYYTTDFETVRPWYVFKKSAIAADYKFTVKRMVLDISISEYGRASLGDVLALESGVLYTYWEGEEKSGWGFCPANGKGKTYSKKSFKNDVDSYLAYLHFNESMLSEGTSFQKAGYLYMLVNASDFFEKGAQSPFPDLMEDSNPVIVKLKLKKK